MKRLSILNYSLFFALLFFYSPLFSNDNIETSLEALSVQPEIAILEELIASTKNTLQTQENLLQLITDYQLTRAKFCEDSENRKLASKLVRSASYIAETLNENHLAHLFPKPFLEEVDFFAGLKNNPGNGPKP